MAEVPPLSDAALASRRQRLSRVRRRMVEEGVDVLLLGLGADLPWLTGYSAMPLERLTMLVVRAAGDPVLVVPALEAPRVPSAGDLFTLVPWTDTEDPVALAARIAGPVGTAAVSDRAWASSVLALQQAITASRWVPASTVTSPVRSVKDDHEIEALRKAGAAADEVAGALQAGEVPLRGRTEAAVSADLARLLREAGHRVVNFAIVGSGPNAASPHHEPGARTIGVGETVVCDFGGALALDGDVGYCSDITRTVVTGPPTPEVVACYEVLQAAQRAGVSAARAGVAASAVDRAARDVIEAAGLGDRFIHRTGHGIGIEEHEDPYLVAGNETPLAPGHAFSVEPGIYEPGRFGMRLEDIVVIDSEGASDPLNRVDHGLVVVEA